MGGDAEEVGAVLEVGNVLADEADIGFVNKGGGLEGVAGALAGDVAFGEAAELFIDDGEQRVERGAVAFAPFNE